MNVEYSEEVSYCIFGISTSIGDFELKTPSGEDNHEDTLKEYLKQEFKEKTHMVRWYKDTETLEVIWLTPDQKHFHKTFEVKVTDDVYSVLFDFFAKFEKGFCFIDDEMFEVSSINITKFIDAAFETFWKNI